MTSLSWLSVVVMLTNFSFFSQVEGYKCKQKDGIACPAGYYCDGKLSGKWQKRTYDCELCPIGKYEDEEQSQKSECKSCLEGQYSSQRGQVSCVSCAVGLYSSGVGASTCVNCEKGKYGDTNGAATCKSCVPGRFSDSVGSNTYSTCLVCDAGYYEDSYGSTSCKVCPSGKFSSWGTTASQCSTECPSGTILRDGKCVVCPSGTTATISRQKCNLCSAGKASDQPYLHCANNGENCACNGIVRRYHYQRNGFEKDAKTGYKYMKVVGSIGCSNEAFGESGSISGKIGLSCFCAQYSTSCSDCTPGKYSDEPVAVCKECAPGFYNTEKGLKICSACNTGKVQPNPGQTDCSACSNGTIASKIELPCQKCKGGTYADAPMQLLCKPCVAGLYSNFNEGSTACLQCPSSRKSPGRTSFNSNGTKQCFDFCPQGSIQLARPDQCQTCASGKYHQKPEATTCTDCIPGMYNEDEGADYRLHLSCETCGSGKYVENSGARGCKLCPSGKFLSNSTSSINHDNVRDCENCTVGRSTENKPGQSKCIECAAGMYARRGSPTCYGPSGLAEVDYLYTATDIQLTLTKFDGGKYHFLSVSGCFSSQFSANRNCSHGSVAYSTASDDDLLQPSGFYVQWSKDINFETLLGSGVYSLNSSHHFTFPINVSFFDLTKIVLHVRIASYNADRGMDVRSKWAIAGRWETVEKCEPVREFLDIDGVFFNEIDATARKIGSNRPTSWRCRRCPTGSNCEGDVTWAQVRAKFGYWRMVKSVENNKKFVSFLECPIHEACLGAKNDDEAFSINHKMYAANLVPLDTYERCNEFLGYERNQRLCGVCQKNYSVKDHFRCKKCSSMHLTVLGAVFSVVAFIALMTFITRTTIKDVDDPKSEAEVIKRIILNYFQVLSLASTFPFNWGDDVVSLFSTMGIFSTLGESFVSIDCLLRQYDKETIFYARQAIYFALPGVVGSLFLVFWVSYSYVVGAKWREKRSSRTETTAKDRFLVSFNGFLFLLYPHSCKVVFSSFSCKQIGEDGDFYLPYDLGVKCYEGRHLEFILIYCVPACLCYVVGLPLAVFYILKKNRAKLDDRAVKLRWGLFFRGFRRKRFYWEVVVAIRKLMIVLIGVLQTSISLKSVMVLAALQFFIHFHTVLKPYPKNKKSLHNLEYSSLLCLFATMCFGMLYSIVDLDFSIIATFAIYIINVTFTFTALRWYISRYLKEHEYFKNSLPPAIFDSCVKLNHTCRSIQSICSCGFGFGFRDISNNEDNIGENEEWNRAFDTEVRSFYYFHEATGTKFWEYCKSGMEEQILKEGETFQKEGKWKRYWDTSNTWKEQDGTSPWYFHNDERCLTKWSKERPNSPPNDNITVFNPLKRLIATISSPSLVDTKASTFKTSTNKQEKAAFIEIPKKQKHGLNMKNGRKKGNNDAKNVVGSSKDKNKPWSRHFNAEHNMYYFESPNRKIPSKWERRVQSNATNDDGLPKLGWMLYFDAKSGEEYFYHSKAGVSRWVLQQNTQ